MLGILIASATTKNLQEIDEDHDDIDVEDQSSNNVVINAELVPLATHDKLGVID